MEKPAQTPTPTKEPPSLPPKKANVKEMMSSVSHLTKNLFEGKHLTTDDVSFEDLKAKFLDFCNLLVEMQKVLTLFKMQDFLVLTLPFGGFMLFYEESDRFNKLKNSNDNINILINSYFERIKEFQLSISEQIKITTTTKKKLKDHDELWMKFEKAKSSSGHESEQKLSLAKKNYEEFHKSLKDEISHHMDLTFSEFFQNHKKFIEMQNQIFSRLKNSYASLDVSSKSYESSNSSVPNSNLLESHKDENNPSHSSNSHHIVSTSPSSSSSSHPTILSSSSQPHSSTFSTTSQNPNVSPNQSSSLLVSNLQTSKISYDWNLTLDHRQRYMQMFNENRVGNEPFVTGTKVKEMFAHSALPKKLLSKIWKLSDITCDGNLDKNEFFVLMRLAEAAEEDVAVPDVLPNELLSLFE